MVGIREAHPERSLLFAGAFFIVLGVVYTSLGKAWTRSSWVYRAKEPKWYWWQIALYYLCGVWLIYIGSSGR